MNYKTTILLNDIHKIRMFVNRIMLFDGDIDMIKGRYVIDAKSIMGIFSLDLSKPVDVIFHATNDRDGIAFMEEMKKYEYASNNN